MRIFTDRPRVAFRAGARAIFPIWAVLTVACSRPPERLAAQTDPQAAAEAARTITAADFERRIGALAHDSMRGRDTPSPELEKAARHIADAFASWGLLPAEGGGYLQSYPLTFTIPGAATAQRVRIDGPGGLDLGGDDVLPLPGGEADAVGPIRVVPLSGSGSLSGSVAVVRVTQDDTRDGLEAARRFIDRGARGVLIAVDAPDAYFAGLRRFFSGEQMRIGTPEQIGAPVVLVRHEALPGGLRAAIEAGPGEAEGYRANLRTRSSFRRDLGHNTIGWIEGSDPELRDEYVIFTAHMDHVGVGRPVGGDSIYNGADDDASGTAAIMELAEAFASLPTPPARSLVFMTVSGEEKGLLGSQWYAENPIFDLDATVANLNIDMIGRNWQDTVVAIGRNESTLGETLERTLAEHAELGLTMIDDPWPEENFYFRSDHYNFARNGVPILFFFTGTHEDYHRPSDEPERILYDKTARIARLIFHLGLEIANAPDRPEWDAAAYRRVVEGGR